MDVENTGRLTLPELLDAFNKLTWYDQIVVSYSSYNRLGILLQCSLDRDAKWLAWFEQQFSMVAGEDRQIDINEFKRALHVKKVGLSN